MKDKLHEVSEIAASGLKNDSELYLSVQLEIEVHLQETAERLENAGQDHDKAIDAALKKFGSPAEAADAILKVNKKRLKFRARLRILLVALIPILAISACLFSIIPSWQYFQMLGKPRYFASTKETTYRKKIANLAGVNLEKLSLENKMLLDRNWGKLHEIFPDDKAYFAYYFMSSVSQIMHSMKSRNSENIYSQKAPAWFKKAHKIDPGNALYNYFAASELLYFGSEYKKAKHDMVIYDNARLMEALPYFIKGLNKPFFNDYHAVIKARRQKLNTNKKTPNNRFWANYLFSNYLYSYYIFDYIEQAMPMWIENLIQTKQLSEAEQIINCWKPYLKQISKSDFNYYTYGECIQMLKTIEKKYPKFYQEIGKTKKGLEAKKEASNLLIDSRKRWNKNSPEGKINQEIFLKHSPYVFRYAGNSFLTNEYKIEDFTAGRLSEYAQADRLLLVIIELLLGALIIGYALCWFILRLLLKKALHPVLFIPNQKTILILIAGGILAPFILWHLLILLQPEGRNVSLDYNSINYLLQGLFLIIGTTLWPIFLTRHFIDLRTKKLGLITKNRLNGLILVLITAVIAGILSCLTWKFPFNLELSTCFSNSYFYPHYIKMYNIYQVKLLHLLWGFGFLATVFVISAPVNALCHWRKSDYLFKQGANAAATLVVLSIMLCLSALLADRYFYWQQTHFMQLDKSPYNFYKRTRGNDYKRILHALDKSKKELKNRPINYFFINDKDFCEAIISSPYSVLKESLKRGVNVNAVNADKYSALMLACHYRNAKIVKLLLKHGAQVNKYCSIMKYAPRLPERLSGVNALMIASYYNPDPEIIKLLIKHGANVNSKALNGYSRKGYNKRRYGFSWLSYKMTPLMFACWNNNAKVINVLLDNGANMWDKNAWGKDILFYLGKNPKIYGNKIKNRIKAMRKAKKR